MNQPHEQILRGVSREGRPVTGLKCSCCGDALVIAQPEPKPADGGEWPTPHKPNKRPPNFYEAISEAGWSLVIPWGWTCAECPGFIAHTEPYRQGVIKK